MSFNEHKNGKRRPAMDLNTMAYGKIPPQANEIEKAILGCILIDSNCLPVIVSLIFTEVFYVDAHQRIYKAILNLYDQNKKVDMMTVVEQLKTNEDLDTAGGPYYVTKLTNGVVSTANIEAYCAIILQKFLSRELIRISCESMGDAFEDSTDIFELYDRIENQISNAQEKVLGGSIKDMQFYSGKVYEQYETVKETGILGIQTGIAPFDKMFCGLVPPDLMVIAARPGQGKTALAVSLTHHISVINQVPGAWFSLEMDGIQLTRRLASIDSRIDHNLIREGKIPAYDEQKFYKSLDKIAASPIFIEDKSGITIRSIRTRSNVLARRNKIKYIVVDYLQLIKGIDTEDKNRDTVIGEITRGLKGLAKELNIPVIALSQLSRKVEERSDKMPQLSDCRESGNIEQDADEVVFLMRPEYYEFTESVEIANREYSVKGLCIGKSAKNRHGACQNFAMYFDGPVMQFSTHKTDYYYTIPPSTIEPVF